MDGNGLDLRTWLTVLGVFLMFFGFPAATIAWDLRKKRRTPPQLEAQPREADEEGWPAAAGSPDHDSVPHRPHSRLSRQPGS